MHMGYCNLNYIVCVNDALAELQSTWLPQKSLVLTCMSKTNANAQVPRLDIQPGWPNAGSDIVYTLKISKCCATAPAAIAVAAHMGKAQPAASCNE